MPFLLAEILNFQCALHLKGVGSLSYYKNKIKSHKVINEDNSYYADNKESSDNYTEQL